MCEGPEPTEPLDKGKIEKLAGALRAVYAGNPFFFIIDLLELCAQMCSLSLSASPLPSAGRESKRPGGARHTPRARIVLGRPCLYLSE